MILQCNSCFISHYFSHIICVGCVSFFARFTKVGHFLILVGTFLA